MSESSRPPLLFHSNAPWSPTGYGQQCGIFTPRLNKHYEVGISSFYGLEGARLRWDGMVVYPGLGGDFGNDSLLPAADAHLGGFRGGLTMTLMDVWVLDPSIIRRLNAVCWVPVDHEPAPPRVIEFFRNSGAIPMAMSRFGEKMLQEFDPLYVPHGIDTEAYRPIPRREARDVTKIPQDKFVVGMVAANKGNPSRKCFAEAFQAFKLLRDRHEDAVLYLHTEMTGKYDGVRLPMLMEALGIPHDSVFFADQNRILHNPVGHDTMAHVYSSLDVLLSPSAGEGFGIPVLEANACGVPAIVTDFSAQPEVLQAGWRVDYRANWTVQESWQATPDVQDIFDALNQAYNAEDRMRDQLAQKAREGALAYDADRVMDEHMLPALAEAERRFAEREPVELKAVA